MSWAQRTREKFRLQPTSEQLQRCGCPYVFRQAVPDGRCIAVIDVFAAFDWVKRNFSRNTAHIALYYRIICWTELSVLSHFAFHTRLSCLFHPCKFGLAFTSPAFSKSPTIHPKHGNNVNLLYTDTDLDVPDNTVKVVGMFQDAKKQTAWDQRFIRIK